MKRLILLFVTCGFLCLNAQGVEDMRNESKSDTNFQFMFNTIDLSTGDGKLLTIDGMGLFYFDQGALLSLDSICSPRLVMSRLKCKFECEDILMCDGKFVVKSGTYVLQLDGEYHKTLFNFDTGLFFLYKGAGSYFNVVIPESNGEWGWYSCDVNTKKVECVARMSAPIEKVIDNGTYALCVCGDTIYYVDSKGIDTFIQCERDIVDAVSTSVGVLFITDEALYLIDGSSEDASPLLEGEMYSLYNDGDVVYIVFRNGDVFRMQL